MRIRIFVIAAFLLALALPAYADDAFVHLDAIPEHVTVGEQATWTATRTGSWGPGFLSIRVPNTVTDIEIDQSLLTDPHHCNIIPYNDLLCISCFSSNLPISATDTLIVRGRVHTVSRSPLIITAISSDQMKTMVITDSHVIDNVRSVYLPAVIR